MSIEYKPRGYTSMAPYLIVDDARGTIEFLTAVFGAQRLRMVPGEGGRLRHAELRIDDTVLMLADALAGWPARAADIHLYVADVDAVYRRALELGAESVQKPEQKDDSDKRGGFRNSGITWWVATQLDPEP
jgi:PhnB protein